jgi:hypothetical protein
VQRDDAVQALQVMLDAFVTGDADNALPLLSSAYLDHQGLGSGPLRGRPVFAEVVSVARSGYSSLQVSVQDVGWEADRLAARLRWHGTRPDGATVDRETIDILRFEDGLVCEHWGFVSGPGEAMA